MKKTLVLGASKRKSSYANLALHRLAEQGIESIGIGIEEGVVAGIPILTGMPELHHIHTITVYLNPKRLTPLLDYIISLHPKRIIFNPGAEYPVIYPQLRKAGIEIENACTLVLLATDQY